jgi:large subunit ribosomal protein L5
MKSLKEQFNESIKDRLKKRLNLSNDLEVPKLDKIVINFGLGESASNAKSLENAIRDMQMISGQKPVITRAKKSIAVFKLREGIAIGLKVTIRKERMYNFFSKLVNVAIPRIRDFQGISPKSFDGRGNYTFGVKEQIIFPEIKYDQVDAIRGMDITICTTARTDEHAKALLEELGMPFKKQAQRQQMAKVA